MRKALLLLQIAATLLLPAGVASASLPGRDGVPTPVGTHESVVRVLHPAKPAAAPRFSNAMLDPRYCNYEYVERQARMIVQSRLELTCTVRQ